jgi:hypothetical protein
MRILCLLPLVGVGCAAPEEEAVAPCTECSVSNEQNFRYEVTLDIGHTTLAELQNSLVEWPSLGTDYRGNPFDGRTGGGEAWLVGFRDTGPDAVRDGLLHDDLAQAAMTVYSTCATEEASCLLGDFGMGGNELGLDGYFAEGSGTWLTVVVDDTTGQAASMMFLEPSATGDATTASFESGTSTLDLDVNFHEQESVVVPAGDPAITLDWSQVSRNGLNDAFVAEQVDELLLGRFEQSRDELESHVWDLETMADPVWTVPVDSAGFATLDEAEGDEAFEGIDGEGTWLFALRCSRCLNPAPRFVGFLEAAP